MIAVVDYHKGNLKSVERGLVGVGADARITDDIAVIAAADAIVLPGVGAFTDAAESMRELGQMELLMRRIRDGVPFLGICLGLHLMFEGGVEHAADGVTPGMGLLPGIVGALPKRDAQGANYKIPHVGWNSIDFVGAAAGAGMNEGDAVQAGTDADAGFGIVPDAAGVSAGAECALFDGISNGEFFYFTHSYAAPACDAAIATTTHSVTFPSAVRVGERAFGVQFHPEKSSDAGARLLANFVALT